MSTLVEDEFDKHRTILVIGPDGWTETLTYDTVDLLVRLGLVYKDSVTSNSHFETTIYKATARPSMEVD